MTPENMEKITVFKDEHQMEQFEDYSRIIGANKTLRENGYFYDIQLARPEV